MEETGSHSLPELAPYRGPDGAGARSSPQYAPFPIPPQPYIYQNGQHGALPSPGVVADEHPAVLDAEAASALQFVQQLLPPQSQLPRAVAPMLFASCQASGGLQPSLDPRMQQAWPYAPQLLQAWPYAPQLLQQILQSRPPPPQIMPQPPAQHHQVLLQPPLQPQRILPPPLQHIRMRPYNSYPPQPSPHMHAPPPPVHPQHQPPPPPPVLDLTDTSMFPALSAAAEIRPRRQSAAGAKPKVASPTGAAAAVDPVVLRGQHPGVTATAASPSVETAAAAAAAPIAGAGVRGYLHTICTRLAQLTPEWPDPLRIAAVEALLLGRQQQQQQPSSGDDQVPSRDAAPVSQHLGKGVPVMCHTLAAVVGDVSDMKYLQTARRLQEELQAAWVHGIPLPTIGGNLLLSDHQHSSSSSNTSLGMMSLFNPQLTSAAAAAAAALAGDVTTAGAADSGDVVQLPQVSSEALTFALFSVWGAAPKVTRLISTTAAAAVAPEVAVAASGTQELSAAAKPVPLPQVLQSWHLAGGLSTALLSSLQQLTAKQQLSSTAVLSGTQQAVLALQPHTGIDFGTNQVVVVDSSSSSSQPEQADQGQGQDDIGDQRHQQQRKQGINGHAVCVDRELTVINPHPSKRVLLLKVCLAPEYREWITLSDPVGITAGTQHTQQDRHLQQKQLHRPEHTDRQQQEQGRQAAGGSFKASSSAESPTPLAVLLPPGGIYTVTIRLSTISNRPRSQAELGVISQVCFVTAAIGTADEADTAPSTAATGAPTAQDLLDRVQQFGHKITSLRSGDTNSSASSRGPVVSPPGWHVCVCGVPVAGGLVSQLAELQSVLRAEAKPFISAALRKVFVTSVAAGSGVAFLAAPTDLGWDVPMNKWLSYNGLAFLGPSAQPGLVPAAAVAQITVQRYQAMSKADSTQPGPQAPLLSWGPPVLQQWQRLLLLEEHACERDMASYGVFNIRAATAVFPAAGHGAEQQQHPQQRRRYSISPWPIQPPEDAQMFTYRGPDLSALLGPCRDPLLAVISVPGLPENRPGLITGDVVYLRLASPVSPEATSHITHTLTLAANTAQSASTDTSRRLQKLLKRGSRKTTRVVSAVDGAEALQQEVASQAARDLERDRLMKLQQQENMRVCALHQLLKQLTAAHQPHGPLHIEVAGLVAAVDGSRCLLVMPDAWWLLLQHLHTYDLDQGHTGAWGAAATAASPMLVHACFAWNRTGFGRMQSVLPYVAVSRRLLLPPDLLTGGGGGFGGQQPAAAAAAAAISAELATSSGLASPQKQQEIMSLAAGLSLCGSVPLNHAQRLAVSSVLCGGGVAAPYVLFGPPGTGKTVTLVEAVLQYRRLHPRSRILCCAPANYSADLLCSALAAAGVGVDEMCKLNDPRRPVTQAKQDTLPYCVFNEGLQTFSLDKGLREAARRSIVVCSTTTAGLLLPQPSSTRPSAALPIRKPGAPYPPATAASSSNWWQQQMAAVLRSAGGLFDLVVVDESGQGLAPEVLLPLRLAKPQAPVLLAGDPRQLGPVLRSATAAAAGLGVSLLDSWIHYWHSVLPQLAAAAAAAGDKQHRKQPPHSSAPVCPVALCYGMLVDNYRSHKRLLDLPSRLFYNGMLRACAPAAAVAPPHWSEIMVKAVEQEQDLEEYNNTAVTAVDNSTDDRLAELCPSSCLFVGVNGQQRQDGDAPSYYNPQEVLVLAELITSLLGTPADGAGSGGGSVADVSGDGVRQAAVSVQDIGVIATYRKQVQKIRLLLRERGLGAVRVGTVDDYQGQEERIIFISTTLTKPESLPPALLDLSPLQQQQHQAAVDSVQQGAIQNPSTAWGSGPSGLTDVGFWRNPKRFNVAITRAKALLVVVGSPRVLVADDNWRQLLQHCVARGAYRGAGSRFLHKLLRVNAAPAGETDSNTPTAAAAYADLDSTSEGLLGAGDDDSNLATAVQAVVEAAQLGVGAAEYLFPQTLDEYYAACQEDQPWKVAI